MKKVFLTVLFCLFASSANAAIYTAYFADDGTDDIVGSWDATECTEGDPCNTLVEAQAVIDDVLVGDTVTLYFARGDTWSMNTDQVSTQTNYGLLINADDPVVNIDAYGSGAQPIWDGTVTDFSTVPEHDTTMTTGPYRWNNVLEILKDGSSVKNIHFNGLYGKAISIGTDTEYSDNITIEACTFSNIGSAAVRPSAYYSTQGTTLTKNLVYNIGELVMYGKISSSTWGAAFSLNPEPGTSRSPANNTISYNVMYNVGGEGIACFNCIVEYNLIGTTSSVAIAHFLRETPSGTTISRYNFIITEDYSQLTGYNNYDSMPGQPADGICIWDETASGENSAGFFEIYGNIIINREYGIRFNNFGDGTYDPVGGVKIFNNTIIDSSLYNIDISRHDAIAVGEGYIYNNTFILYDRVGSTHALDYLNPVDFSTYWTVDNNAFWTTGGSPTVDLDWRTNYVITDPKLYGEEKGSPIDWDGQSGSTYYKDILFADIIPETGSSLIDAGKSDTGYEATFLIEGTDFSVLPEIETFVTGEQGSEWDIGGAMYREEVDSVDPGLRFGG